jgi:hypothetical protein
MTKKLRNQSYVPKWEQEEEEINSGNLLSQAVV